VKLLDIIGLAIFRVEKDDGKLQGLIRFIQLNTASRWIGISIEDVHIGIVLDVNISFLRTGGGAVVWHVARFVLPESLAGPCRVHSSACVLGSAACVRRALSLSRDESDGIGSIDRSPTCNVAARSRISTSLASLFEIVLE
jgi:hypothetical protein